ncbi:MAG: 4-hydroxybutyrate CoA-transferase [Frankiales bacterium]|jgi:acyl-CoA hydrolase|nr:4-hydroxybutyrate CoA-transferase [Frankiales bacterium]
MRTISPEGLARTLSALPQVEPRVVTSGNAATHLDALGVVDGALERYRLFLLNAPLGVPSRPGVTLETPFVGPGQRDQPGLAYVPARLSLVPLLFGGRRPPDVVVLHTTTPRAGTVSLGIEVNILPAAIEQARARGGLVVAVMNPAMPFTYGDAVLPVDEVDLAVEMPYPLPSPGVRARDDVSQAIGDRVAALVPNGATLQLGIGAVPDATLAALGSHRSLRVFTEMFSDGVLDLHRRGVLDAEARLVSSFLMGSPELYAWVDRNPSVRVLRTEKTNDPSVIARQRAMTSVNTAMQIDLYAQANASRRPGGSIFSGFGGSTDFIVGALHSSGGQALLALASWHPKAGVSTVVELVDGPVTSFQHSALVTEQGVAQVFGGSQAEQAQAVLGVAHPRVRDALRAAAQRRGLIAEGVSPAAGR